MKLAFLFLLLFSFVATAQHDHATVSDKGHLGHIQESRKNTIYIHNLPAPQLMSGVGTSTLKIQTKSDSTQKYFSQGVALLHCFWDLEAYRAFKEAIRHDSTAIMPYWGLASASMGDEFKADKELAIRKLKSLRHTASEHEKLYAESEILADSLKENGQKEAVKKLEQIVHKFPSDTEAKLFLALNNMNGYDLENNPNEGQLYGELLIKQILSEQPDNAAAHHYWIHLMENCCPEKALDSADKLAKLTPASGHMVHMPGHIYHRVGDYTKAYNSFVASMKVDSLYMKQQHIQEVDTWNYIHNIHYLLANCSQDGRYKTALFYAEKLKNMPVNKDRKKAYGRNFFGQGIMAPSRMEWCFGFYDRAAERLNVVTDPDTLYGAPSMAYKDAMKLFFKGMDAAIKNKLAEARNYSTELDAFLFRNEKMSEAAMPKFFVDNLIVCSLELQGWVKGLEGKYDEAVTLLNKANKKELALGYSEPAYYARPVLISQANLHLQNGKYDQALACWDELTKRYPNNVNSIWGNYLVYKKKGDKEKTKEYAGKLIKATQFGDKILYPL